MSRMARMSTTSRMSLVQVESGEVIVDHEDFVEITLSGGQRRTLRDRGKGLQSFEVADVSQAISQVQDLLVQDQLLKLKFVSCEKKPEAQLQANELAAMTGSAVAECKGNECLLYRPPSEGQGIV